MFLALAFHVDVVVISRIRSSLVVMNRIFLLVFKMIHGKQNVIPSIYNPKRFDQTEVALTWLKSFQILNERFLSKVNYLHCHHHLMGKVKCSGP